MIPFILQIYFGLLLTIAGLSKLDNPISFEVSLRRLSFKSDFIVRLGRRFFPLYEIMLGIVLVMGWFSLATALLTVVTFIIFLGAKVQLAKRNAADCGCFGQERASVDAASLTTSIIFLLLAILHLVLVSDSVVSSAVRLIGVAFYMAYIVFYISTILKKRKNAVLFRGRSYK